MFSAPVGLYQQVFIPAFKEMKDCLEIVAYAVNFMKINNKILDDKKYDLIFSVEEVNKLVLQGVPFREAYRQIGNAIEEGNFTYQTTVKHVHEGSIGNLQNKQIIKLREGILKQFPFSKVHEAINALINK